jgi:hypothetical protein
MAVIPGVVGSAGPVPGESGRIGLVALLSESCVTGRIVAPLKSGELDADLGERGVKGLGPSELWSPGVTGDETLSFFDSVLHELKSRLGTVEVRFDMSGGNWTQSRMYGRFGQGFVGCSPRHSFRWIGPWAARCVFGQRWNPNHVCG